MIEASIVILNWHMNDLTSKCIESIIKNTDTSKLGLVIIDQEVAEYNNPEWRRRYKNKFSEIMTMYNITNIGVPRGYNQGIKISLTMKPKYICIMNNDIEVLPNWYEEFKRCLESDPKIGIVGGKSLPPGDNPNCPAYHGGIVAFTDGHFAGKKIEVPQGAPDLNLDIETYCVGFACAMIKTEVFEQIGLFDEKYSPCDYEDTDFCFHARSEGWKVVSCIPSKYYHIEGATIKKKNFEIDWDKNRKYFLSKWSKML